MEINVPIITETIGWIGNIFFFIGAILMAKRQRIAFFHQIMGNLFYVIQAIIMSNWSLGALSVILIGVNIWGWLNWKRLEGGNV